MPAATLRFYEELNDFLPPRDRKHDITVNFTQRDSIKDLIESLGVPHTEIDLILVNQEPVDFSYIVHNRDRISVYPVFESLDISSLNRLRPEPLRRTRFVLDTHLGKLAKYLRMLGFDTLYDNHYTDHELADLASSGERRILLTRDVGLLKYKKITHGYFVRDTTPRKQIREILDRFDLRNSLSPFRLCVNCNGVLDQLDKAEARRLVPPGIYRQLDEFVICHDCRRVYWKGSHYDRMTRFIDALVKD